MDQVPAASRDARPLIERPRLLARLSARYDHRLTIVTGGGGTGKTSLLRQAAAGEPRGLDVIHECGPIDVDPDHLLASLASEIADAVEATATTGDRAPAIGQLLLGVSPRHVCIMLDDTHVLDDGAGLERLLTALPENGHLVLAGRRPPPIDLGRLDMTGRLLEIGQDELLMTEPEQISFANQRGVNIELLAGAEGWPAFVELAASGSEVRSRRYLQEEALRTVAPERRHALAAFAFVGGGDDEICRAVTGRPLDDVIADLPLVRWVGETARLHDLWGELLIGDLGHGERTTAVLAASTIHRRRGAFDTAIELARSVGDWSDLSLTLATAVREGVDGGLGVDQLDRWRRLVPAGITTDPIVMLLDGLIAREADSTSPKARALLQAAADGYAAAGDHDLELAALLQLGYAVRIVGDLDLIDAVMTRIGSLAEHHDPARPYLAFGEAWAALAQARPDLQLAAMERITEVDLPPVWAKSREHYLAHALFNLGRPHEALEHARRMRAHDAVAIPGSLVTELQCLWFAGHPDEALRRSADGLSAGHGARDRFIAGAWRAAMCAYAGDVAGARSALEVAQAHQGDQPGLLTAAQTILAEGVIDIAEGHEETACERFRAALEFAPLGSGLSEQTLRNLLPTPYILLPETRPFWDDYAVGPSIVGVRRIAQAYVAASEADDHGALATIPWPDAPALAATFPVPLAMRLAIHGVVAGRHEGRHLAAWLCEHWGEPAVRALRRHGDDPVLGAAARDLISSTPAPPSTTVRLGALGPAMVWHDDHPTADPHWRRERVRALLVALVLKPNSTRDQLAGMLWPDHSINAAAKNLRTTLSYLHAVLEPHRESGAATWCVQVDGSSVRLNPRLDVDVWRFRQLLDDADDAERRGRPDQALPSLRRALTLWRGDLAEDLELELLDLERIHLRSRFVRASCRVTELLTAMGRPDEAIETARPALELDRWHEATYLALADAYTAVGDHTSARAVLDRGAANLGVPLEGRGAATLRP